MNTLTQIAGQLGKLIPRLASNFDAEVISTVRAIERILKTAGCDWHDLAKAIELSPQASIGANNCGDWRSVARFCVARSQWLAPRELDFLTNIARQSYPPTEKQLHWLYSIANRLRAAA